MARILAAPAHAKFIQSAPPLRSSVDTTLARKMNDLPFSIAKRVRDTPFEFYFHFSSCFAWGRGEREAWAGK